MKLNLIFNEKHYIAEYYCKDDFIEIAITNYAKTKSATIHYFPNYTTIKYKIVSINNMDKELINNLIEKWAYKYIWKDRL